MNSQKFCLKWDHFRRSVTSVFNHLRRDGELVDITLCCEGQRVKAHRMMLSACSPYFRELLKENPCQHPVFFLKDTSAEDLRAVIEFVYNGEVNVAQGQLASFIKTAEMLQIRGLSGEDEDGAAGPVSGGAPAADRRPPPAAPPERPRSPPAKRRRRSGSPPESAAPAPVGPPPVPRSQPPPPPPPSQPDEITVSDHSPVNVKVEADLAKTEDDPSLEAALGRVVYDGSDAELASLTADDSLGEAGPSGGLSAERSMQAVQYDTPDAMVSAQVRAHDPLPAPAASAGTNTSYTPFDLAWLDASTRDRLLRGLPFQRNDWCRLVGAIFDSISSTFDRTCNRSWYTDVTCDLLDRFPHLFAGMSTREAMTFMRTKLRTKAKNTRHRFVQLHRRRSVPQ